MLTAILKKDVNADILEYFGRPELQSDLEKLHGEKERKEGAIPTLAQVIPTLVSLSVLSLLILFFILFAL